MKSAAAPAACHPPAAPGDPPACATGDAGAGRWEIDAFAPSSRPTWRPEACRLRPAGTTELRCALRGKRIAFLGDSLLRNLFHGLVHHTGLLLVKGREYGTKAKQSDAYAVDAGSDILVQLHWAACAIPTTDIPPSAEVAAVPLANLQWGECQGASIVGNSRPLMSRDLQDIFRGFSTHKHGSGGVDPRCPAEPAWCVTKGGDAVESRSPRARTEYEVVPLEVSALPSGGRELCMAGYSTAAGQPTSLPRSTLGAFAPEQLLELVRSTWRQLCEPPDIVVMNLGLWQTELATLALPALESAIREHLLGIGVGKIIFMLPFRYTFFRNLSLFLCLSLSLSLSLPVSLSTSLSLSLYLSLAKSVIFPSVVN